MSEAAVLLADHLLPDLREIDNLNRSLPCSAKKTAAAAVKTYTCELRLKDEIPPDFTLDECRARFLAEHPNEAKAIWETPRRSSTLWTEPPLRVSVPPWCILCHPRQHRRTTP